MNTTSYMPVWLTNGVRRTFIAMTVVLAIGLTACTPEDLLDIFDDDDTEQPADNSDDKNTVTVTSEGALVSHGDISVNFPKGTFTSDSKVTISPVKKGEVSKKYEASTFYKVTIPATTRKKLTIKLKSDKNDDDVNFVMLSTGFAMSSQKERQIECYPETQYADGEYKMTIPANDNGENAEEMSFTIGLGHIPTFNNAGVKATRGLTNMNWALASDEVDSVSWNIYMSWEAWSIYDWGTMEKMKDFAPLLNDCIKDAIKQIRKLGFKLNGQHDIPYYFGITDNWGEHVQHWLNNDMWSSLYIGIPKILEANCKMTSELRQTVIHETLHYFQSDYDPRYITTLKRGENEHVSLAEMGAVWIEKFMNAGQLSADFQKEPNGVGVTRDNKFRLGLSTSADDIRGMFQSNPYQDYGYSLGPLLYYMTTNGKAYGITDNSVVEIYDKWSEFATIVSGKTTLDFLYAWTKSHNWNIFFGGEDMDDYYLKLWKGELIKGFNYAAAMSPSANPLIRIENSTYKKDLPVGKIYPFGCEGLTGSIKGFKDTPMTDMELVIKQQAPNVKTYLLLTNSAEQTKVTKITQHTQTASWSEDFPDSIVVSGSELEALRSSDGSFDIGFMLLTTRPGCYSTKGSIPSKATIELRNTKVSVTPTELAFESEGGTKEAKMTAKGNPYFGVKVDKDYSNWLSAKADKYGKVEVTAKANTSSKERIGYVQCYIAKSSNSPESERIYTSPIKVTQEAGEGKGGLYHIEAYITGKISADYSTTLQSGTVATGVTTYDIDFYAETDIEYSGGDLQIQISDDDNTPETLSFTVSNLTGDYTGSSAHNIKYVKETGIAFAAKYVRDENNYTATTLEISSLPVDAGSAYKSDYGGTLWFIGSGTSGLQGVSFKHHWEEDTTDGMYGPVNGHKSGDATYRSDENNHLSLKCGFWRKSDSSSAPRRLTSRTKIPYLPVNSATSSSRASLPTHAKASIR